MAVMTTTETGGELDLYLELIRAFPLRPIRSESELDSAIEMVDRLSDREELASEEEDYRDILAGLIETYESEHYVFEEMRPGALLRHMIEAKGITQAKLAKDVDVRESTISEIISGKRDVSRSVMKALGDYFNVDPAIFI